MIVIGQSNPTNRLGMSSTRPSKQPRVSAPTSFVNEDDDSMDEIQNDDDNGDAEAEGAGSVHLISIAELI